MTPAEELEMLELEAEAARNKSQKTVPQGQRTVLAPDELSEGAQEFRPGGPSSEPVGYGAQLLGGAKHTLQRTMQGLAGLVGAEVVSPRTLSAGKAFINETGPLSTVGEVGGDIALQALPGAGIAKGAGMLSKAVAASKFAKLAIPVSLAVEAGGNAALNAAVNPENRDTAALFGAGGALAGRALGNISVGPLRDLVSPEAKTLMDRNIFLTPGQAVTGKNMGNIARVIRNSEDAVSSYPVVGAISKSGQIRSMAEHNISELNQALAPVGAKVRVAGREGVAKAEELVSEVYDKVLPKYFAPSAKVEGVIDNFVDEAIKHNSQFSGNARIAAQYQHPVASMNWQPHQGIPQPGQIQTKFNDLDEQEVVKFIERRIRPLIATGDISGPVAKDIDSRLGDLARVATSKKNEPLAETWNLLRDQLRNTYHSNDPAVLSTLQSANAAWKNLRPMVDASEKTLTGDVTPRQLQTATIRLGHKPTETGVAARDVLPNKVPESGAAERLIFNRFLSPAAAASAYGTTATFASALAPVLGATALIGGAYTKPGMKFLTEGSVPILQKTLNALRSGPPTNLNAQTIKAIVKELSTRGVTAGTNSYNEGE